ncbi:hypothetical protein Q5P01_005223 [Channa striata]|uniref:Uncharacterized protein n=1 Tax=Channa striata TaxID=64152 RepID=A0AA88NH78_CHASR|nr:hypothetical protein Q5P01_005223 [Channa striata]
MKEGQAVGKETVRETKIEGAREWEGNRKREITVREKKKTERSEEMDVHLHKRERKRKEGEEGAGDRGGLSPFLHPTLRAPLLDRATSDQPRRRASAPMTEPPRLAVPATGWIPTEYTDERQMEAQQDDREPCPEPLPHTECMQWEYDGPQLEGSPIPQTRPPMDTPLDEAPVLSMIN